jgi:hypothetical protein
MVAVLAMQIRLEEVDSCTSLLSDTSLPCLLQTVSVDLKRQLHRIDTDVRIATLALVYNRQHKGEIVCTNDQEWKQLATSIARLLRL